MRIADAVCYGLRARALLDVLSSRNGYSYSWAMAFLQTREGCELHPSSIPQFDKGGINQPWD